MSRSPRFVPPIAPLSHILLAKVEELTLHMIQEHDRNDRLEKQNRELHDEIRQLRGVVLQGTGVKPQGDAGAKSSSACSPIA